MEQATKNMALVNFDRSAATYKVLGVIPLANFTASNSTIEEIRATMTVG